MQKIKPLLTRFNWIPKLNGLKDTITRKDWNMKLSHLFAGDTRVDLSGIE